MINNEGYGPRVFKIKIRTMRLKILAMVFSVSYLMNAEGKD